jgi:hypothetical protein
VKPIFYPYPFAIRLWAVGPFGAINYQNKKELRPNSRPNSEIIHKLDRKHSMTQKVRWSSGLVQVVWPVGEVMSSILTRAKYFARHFTSTVGGGTHTWLTCGTHVSGGGGWDPPVRWGRGCVTTQDFIKFWGNFFAFVLLEMIEIHRNLKTFEPIWKLY